MANGKPGLIKRVRATWNFFRNGMPRYTERPKAAPFLWPDWRRGKPEWQIVDVESYINEGFNLNSLIYSCVMFKVRQMTLAPLRAYKGDRDNPEPLDEGHPLAKLVARPNPHQSWQEFHGQNITYRNIAGNYYVYMDRPSRDALPEAMYSLRPDRTYIVPDTKGRGLKGYLYVPEGKTWRDGTPILPQDMMHVKLPNPGDPLEGMGYGLSPISPLARSADVDNSITHFLKLFFERGGMIMGALKFDVPMTNEDVAQARERWMEIYGGYENWTEVAVLDQGGEYQRTSPTFEEMGFEGIDERNEARILGPFGVPPICIGSRIGLKRATYSNYEEARRQCWEDTMLPETVMDEVEYQYFLQGEGNEFVAFDLSQVPGLRRDINKQAEAFANLIMSSVPPNVAKGIVGLDFEDIPGGDVSYLPMNLMPMGSEPPKPQPQGEPAGAVEEERTEGKRLQKLADERKQLAWKVIDLTASSWERRFAQLAQEQFERDKRKLLAILSKGKQKALEEKATVDWDTVYMNWLAYLEEAGELWRMAFLPAIKGVITDQAKQLEITFGIRFDVTNLWTQVHFDTYTLTFAQDIMDTTKDAMTQMFRQALDEGWSIPTMQGHLETLFSQWMKGDKTPEDFKPWFKERMPRHRTEAIARTETMRASNYGNYEIHKAFGLGKHQWWCNIDGRERDSHRAAHKQIRNIGEAFEVGGQRLLHPHDSSLGAGPEEIVNCRCAALPWKQEWEEWEAREQPPTA